MIREMGNEGAVLQGMEQAPEKFSDTIRMSLLLYCSYSHIISSYPFISLPLALHASLFLGMSM